MTRPLHHRTLSAIKDRAVILLAALEDGDHTDVERLIREMERLLPKRRGAGW